jgi:hypothetical protein
MIFLSAKDAKGHEERLKGFTSRFFAFFADRRFCM